VSGCNNIVCTTKVDSAATAKQKDVQSLIYLPLVQSNSNTESWEEKLNVEIQNLEKNFRFLNEFKWLNMETARRTSIDAEKLDRLVPIDLERMKVVLRTWYRAKGSDTLSRDEVEKALKSDNAEEIKSVLQRALIEASYATSPTTERLVADIQESCFTLWDLVGTCLYSDIPCADLARRVPEIVQRYSDFAKQHNGLSQEELIAMGLAQNVDMIGTDYCIQALMVLQHHVCFDVCYYILYDKSICSELSEEKQIQACGHMKAWLNKNHDNLEWYPSKQQFGPKGGVNLPFVFPPDVAMSIGEQI
jgi:hypothetical protein